MARIRRDWWLLVRRGRWQRFGGREQRGVDGYYFCRWQSRAGIFFQWDEFKHQDSGQPALGFGAGGGFTIMAWIKPANQNFQEICEWNLNDGVPSGAIQIGTHLEINEHAGDGSLVGGVVDATGIAHNLFSAAGIITPNSFQHIAMTYDKASGVAVLYRNGVILATTNLGVFTPQTSFDFFLGDRPSGFFTGSYFQGEMGEIGIYNRALSVSEIQAVCTEQNNGEQLPPPTSAPGINGIYRNGFNE